MGRSKIENKVVEETESGEAGLGGKTVLLGWGLEQKQRPRLQATTHSSEEQRVRQEGICGGGTGAKWEEHKSWGQ